MCRPASFVLSKDKVFWSKSTDSHEDIIEEFELVVSVASKITILRVEITPPNGDMREPLEKWSFKVDQDIRPKWFELDKDQTRARAALTKWYAYRVMLDGNRELSGNDHVYCLGGELILFGNSSADMYGNSSAVMRENSSAFMWDNSSAVMDGNRRAVMRGNSSSVMHGNSSAVMWDNSSAVMWGISSADMYGNSRADMYGNSRADGHEKSTIVRHSKSATFDLHDTAACVDRTGENLEFYEAG